MATTNGTDTMKEPGTIGEQFRKTAEVTNEQARQTLGAAQDQLKKVLTEAQHVQSDVAKMLVRMNDQNSQLVTATLNCGWDASQTMLKTTLWSLEQAEKGVRQLMDQAGTVREEGTAILREATEQARHHQTELSRLTQEGLRVSLFYAGKTTRGETESTR